MGHVIKAATLLAMVPTLAVAHGLSATAGSSISSGRYGGVQSSTIVANSAGLRATYSGWSLSATLPYLRIDNGDKAVSLNGVVVGPALNSRRPSRGYGDVTLVLDRSVLFGDYAPIEVRFQARAKLPTGARTLSTGKVDTVISADISKPLGPITPYVSLGYSHYGDSARLRLTDGWTIAGGTSATVEGTTILAAYEWSQSAVGGPAAKQLFGAAVRQVGPDWGVSVYGSKGLSAGAPNLMVGMALTRSFSGR